MEKKLVVSPSPHIHTPVSTTRLMIDVLIALFPALVVSVIVYGGSALLKKKFWGVVVLSV